MNKYAFIFFVVIICACEGRLTDEQRKEMKKQMELHKIKRVTDVEITEAALAKGRSIVNSIESFKTDSARIDSLLKVHHGKVRWLVPGKGNAAVLEQQLIDAYISAESGSLQDNLQKIRNAEGESDSLLYTKPVVIKLPDGSERLEGVWNIWLSKKELILAMDK